MAESILAPAARSLVFSTAAVLIAAPPGLALAAVLGTTRSRWRRGMEIVARAAMAFPTVVVGLIAYGVYSRAGPLGDFDLLFTPQAIVTGEVLLAVPLFAALGAASIRALDPRFLETTRALRLSRIRVGWLAIREARDGVAAASCAAFARCVTELGVALMVGGNLVGANVLSGTRTLTTAIALETSRGDFDRGLRLGLVLVAVAVVVNLAAETLLRRRVEIVILRRLRGARVRYGDVSVPLPNLDLGPRERVAVLGRNGAGKSTLLRVLAGLIAAEGDVGGDADPRDVACVAQRPYLLRGAVGWNVELALSARGVGAPERRGRARAALARFGIDDLADRPRNALSEGQIQRVAFARALVASPRVLLLDEPLGPLDAEGARRVAEVLREEADVAVVVASPTPAGLPDIAYSRTIELR